MKNVTEIFRDPSLCGHLLVRPAQWYGRQVESLFKAPVPPESYTACEITARAITAVVLLVIIPAAALFALAALAGLGVKCLAAQCQVQSPAPDQSVNPKPPAPELVVPQTPAAPDQSAEPQPSTLAVSQSISSNEKIPVEAIRQKVAELRDRYNHFTELNKKGVKSLSDAIKDFQIHFGRYRNPDNAALEKSFQLFDQIESNVKGMERFLDCLDQYQALLRFSADDQGVVWRPADGSCWLHVFYLGLQHSDPLAARNHTIVTLRAEVVKWIRDNLQKEETQNYLAASILDHMDARREGLALEQASLLAIPTEQNAKRLESIQKELEEPDITQEAYLDQLSGGRAFGGNVEFYALSQIFKVNIVIWFDSRPQIRNLTRGMTFEFPGSEITINAVKKGTHYNYRLPAKEAS